MVLEKDGICRPETSFVLLTLLNKDMFKRKTVVLFLKILNNV